jgi:hypothetical protein
VRPVLLVPTLALALATGACEGEASRDYDKCVAASQRGDFGAAIPACRRAAGEDSSGSVGAAARDRLPALHAALEHKEAEATAPAPKRATRRRDALAEPDLAPWPFDGDPERDADPPTCEDICNGGANQCHLVATRAPTPGAHERCEAERRACSKSCAEGKGPR